MDDRSGELPIAVEPFVSQTTEGYQTYLCHSSKLISVPPSHPLIDPASYFEHKRDPLTAGLLVFAAHIVAVMAFVYWVVTAVFDAIENPPSGLERALSDMVPTLLFFVILSALIAYAVVAAIMHYGSGGSGTSGTFGDAAAVAGWAYAPNLLATPLQYLTARRYLDSLSLTASDPEALQAQIEAAQTAPGAIGLAIQVGIVLWSVYILAQGVSATHDVDVETAAVPAVVIGIGALLLAANSML